MASIFNILTTLTNYGVFCGFLNDSNPKGSCTLKVLLVSGRIGYRCAFRLVKGGTFWKFVIILFHELVALGNELFLYLKVLHLIS